jgi:Domain of unknown function (DUF6968)
MAVTSEEQRPMAKQQDPTPRPPIFLNRTLKIETEGGEKEVPIRFYLPTQQEDDWECEYEIDWPTGARRFKAHGIDSVQSLLLALQMVGAELYTSDAHRAGKLMWLERGGGYGFVVPQIPQTIRDLYEGDDQSL